MDKKSVPCKNIKIWTVEHDQYGYHTLPMCLWPKEYVFHRLVYFVHYRNEIQLDTDMHVSNISHNMSGINFEHLSYESPAVNNSHKVCKNTGECVGHHGYADCIL